MPPGVPKNRVDNPAITDTNTNYQPVIGMLLRRLVVRKNAAIHTSRENTLRVAVKNRRAAPAAVAGVHVLAHLLPITDASADNGIPRYSELISFVMSATA